MEFQQTLGLVTDLISELKSNKVVYCHWKSNAYLDRSANGENDLDLLISRSNASIFTEILIRLGFVQAFEPHNYQIPGVLDYYGIDKKTLKIVHVHAHYQLIMGHDATKNYHLPIEKHFLKSIIQDQNINIPAPELEFIVLVVRLMIKHFNLCEVILGTGKLSATERQELVFLKNKISQSKIENTIHLILPTIDNSLFANCVESLTQECSMYFRIKSGEKLRKKLSTYARRSWLPDNSLKIWRRFEGGIKRRFLRTSGQKKFATGGLMISIIGGDGAGKTTAIDNLYDWFSKEFKIIRIHMGKPSWSLTTTIIHGILKIGRSLNLYPFINIGSENTLYNDLPIFPGYPWLIREVCTAHDRYLSYRAGRRFASNGGLVICDRFPIPIVKKMDGPQVDRCTQAIRSNKIINLLQRIEEKYYKQINLPDLLITLRLDPDIAVQRKCDEGADSVRSRSEEIWNINWNSIPAFVIDASKGKNEVFSDIMSLIWSQL